MGFLIFGMRYYYMALTDRRLIFMNASFWSAGVRSGLAWADPRDSVTISDLKSDNKLWNWGRFSSPTKQNLRMNFHAFWRPELKAMGDLLTDRIVGPRLCSRSRGRSDARRGRRSVVSAASCLAVAARHGPLPPSERPVQVAKNPLLTASPAWVPGVAQSGRALPSHGRGQGFESLHLH